jgi:hypothetical protein
VVELPQQGARGTCTEPPAITFEVDTTSLESVTVESVQPVVGNCFEVLLKGPSDSSSASGGTSGTLGEGGFAGEYPAGGEAGAAGAGNRIAPEGTRLYLCAPIELFPFTAGDTVALSVDDYTQTNGYDLVYREGPYRLTLATLDDRRGFRMRLGDPRSDGAAYYETTHYRVIPGDTECGVMRDRKGKPWVPAKVDYSTRQGGDAPRLPQGDTLDLSGPNGSFLVYLGRSRDYLGAACYSGEPWVEIVESWSP